MKKMRFRLRSVGAPASQALLVVFFAALGAHVVPQAQPPAAQAPDYNAFYQIGPDSLPHEGVPKGEVRGPFVLPSQAYPGRSTPTGCTCRRSTTRRSPRA